MRLNRLALLCRRVGSLPSAVGAQRRRDAVTRAAPRRPAVDRRRGGRRLDRWPGRATPRTARTDPSVDWVKPFEDADRLQGQPSSTSARPTRRSTCSSNRPSTTSCRLGRRELRMIARRRRSRSTPPCSRTTPDLVPLLKDQAVELGQRRQIYGMPHGWGANLLMYNKDVVKPAPDSWGAVFDAISPYKGKVTGYDSPIYIADGALVSDEDQARPRDQGPVRARRRRSSTPSST